MIFTMQDMMLGLMIAALISEIFVDSIARAVFFFFISSVNFVGYFCKGMNFELMLFLV